ncbi:hypothetical protein ACXO2T_06360, partial [Lactobacillus delbrueckii subsp. bulgaricus]
LVNKFFDIFFSVSPANSFFAATTDISILVIFERSNHPFHSLYILNTRQSCDKVGPGLVREHQE